jgi:hypothetical protein
MSTTMQGLEMILAAGDGGYILLKEASAAIAVFVPEFVGFLGAFLRNM